MRIVTWNMGAAMAPYSKPELHHRAWDWLLNECKPDLALLQEAIPPYWTPMMCSTVIGRRKYSRRPWGNAIVSHDWSLEEIHPDSPWLATFAGSVLVGRCAELGLTVASIHSNSNPVNVETLASHDHGDIAKCHETDVWEIDLIAPELRDVLGTNPFVVGGDLNSALQFDEWNDYDNNRLQFANLSNLGYIDTRTRHSTIEQPSLFIKNRRPVQVDHLFADAATEQRVVEWRVLTEVAVELGLSDHAPVEIVLE